MSIVTPHTLLICPHTMATGNTTVDKMRIKLYEYHQVQEETQQQTLLQKAVDQYLYHLLKNGEICCNNPSEQPRLQKEVQPQ